MKTQQTITLALMKFNEGVYKESFLIPSKVHIEAVQRQEYVIGDDLNIRTSVNRRYNRYWNFKAELLRSGTALEESDQAMRTSASRVRVGGVKEKEGPTPVDIAEKYLSRLCETVVSQIRRTLGDTTQIRFSFTSPSVGRVSSQRYRDRIRQIIDKIGKRKSLKGSKFGSKEFLYEQLGVYYYYAACEPKVDLRTPNATYLIVDIGGSTTDIAIVQTGNDGKLSRAIPTFESLKWGGSNYDQAIFEMLIGDDSLADPSELDELLERIEELKLETLANPKKETTLNVQIQGGSKKLLKIDYAFLERVFDSQWQVLREAILDVIRQAHETRNQLVYDFEVFEMVFLAGGMARLPFISKKLHNDPELKNYVRSGKVVLPEAAHPSCLAALGLATETVHRILPNLERSLFKRGQSVYFRLLSEKRQPPLGVHRVGSDSSEANLLFKLNELEKEREDSGKYWFKEKWEPQKNREPDFNMPPLGYLPPSISFEAWSDVHQTPIRMSIKARENIEQQSFALDKLALCLRVSVDCTNQLEELLKQSELEAGSIILTPYLLLAEASKNPLRFDGRLEEKKPSFSIKVPLVPEKLKAETEEVFVCIDFGMSNTCVAIYAPGKEEQLRLHLDTYELFNITVTPEKNDIDEGPAIQPKTQIGTRTQKSTKHLEEDPTLSAEKKIEGTVDAKSFSGLLFEPVELFKHMTEKYPALGKSVEVEGLTYSGFAQFVADYGMFYSASVLESVWSETFENTSNYLIVLAGPPGTGKSSLAHLAACYFNGWLPTATVPNPFFALEAVSPAWFSPQSLLGSYSPLDGRFHPTDFLSFLFAARIHFEAHGNKAGQFIVCLDEFNLAHPEQYFANILSVMESHQKLLNVCSDPHVSIVLPPNLKFFATVNIDSTTKPLSWKVLDRSRYIRIGVCNRLLEKQLDQCIKKQETYGSLIAAEKLKKEYFEPLLQATRIAGIPLSYRSVKRLVEALDRHPALKDTSDPQPDLLKRILDSVLSEYVLAKLPGIFSVDAPKEYQDALAVLRKLLVAGGSGQEIIDAVIAGRAGQGA